jgi:2-polyprenyl-3-methyl-5-hydroxy-6-metoxy-1,4-benzoquinol methylase
MVNELILPDELTSTEKRFEGQTRLAEWFRFWRARFFLSGIFVGLVLVSKNLIIGISLIFISIVLDYLILRSRAKMNFQRQIIDLNELLHTGFYESDNYREDHYETDIGKRKIMDNNPANILRKVWVSKIAEQYFRLNYRVLDAGCKGGQVASFLVKKTISVFGVDLNRSALKNFVKRCKGSCVQANILQLPFKRSQFHAALCTEVIEHLYNPIQGLSEIANVIKPDGLIILSTDNRNHLNAMDILNPLIIFERIIGLVFPEVLKPRNLVWKWGKDFKIYHTNFSRTEIISLVKEAELEIVSCFSYSFLHGLHKIIGRIKPNMIQDDYVKVIFPIERILANIPILKSLGDHWIMVLRKTEN